MEERFKQSMGKKCGDEEGETKRMKQKRKHFLLFPCHEPPFLMTLPLSGLATFCCVMGYLTGETL